MQAGGLEKESEEVHSPYAKISPFRCGKRKERGQGYAKLLWHTLHDALCHATEENDEACQLLVLCGRRFVLLPHAGGEMSWKWIVLDSSEVKLDEEHFALKFESEEMAHVLYRVFDKSGRHINRYIFAKNTT